MVELQLLEGGQGTIARFDELQTASFVVVELVQAVGRRFRIPEKRQRNCHDTHHREQGGENQGERQRVAGTPISRVLSTSRRCSRASGHIAMSDPRRKTRPATQIRFTSGFTKTRK